MLAFSLPPNPWINQYSAPLAYENLALTLLSYYTADEVSSRVIDSFKRAFGMDDILFVPPGTNNTPKAVIAVWNGSENLARRATLAIQGYSSITQLKSSFQNFSTVDAFTGNLPGHVWTQPKIFADDLWTRVFSTTASFATPFSLQAPGSMLAFNLTGFSLGAAIAEILAYKMKSKRFTTNIRLEKFGSPRVGTRAWNRGLDRRVFRVSHYCDRDPVSLWPFMNSSTLNLMGPTGLPFTAHYAPEPTPLRCSFGFEETLPEPADTVLSAIESELQFVLIDMVNRPWNFHSSDQYLAHFLIGCRRAGGAIEKRFRYLEYPGRNNIGDSFPYGAQFQALQNINLGSPPDPYGTPLPSSEQRVVETRALQPVIPQQSSDGEGGGDIDWGTRPALTQSLVAPRRARR